MKQLLLGLTLFFSVFIFAQKQTSLSYYFPETASFDASIPTPESILGFQVGDWHVSHDKLIEYCKALAAASDRVHISFTGKTYEERPLVLLTITSKENHSNLENIRKEHLKISDVGKNKQLDLQKMPVIIYQGFSVHGNEPSGANSALLYAYFLAASTSNEVEEQLQNTVVLLDPCLNPDGFQRFAYWANTNKSEQLNTDVNNREFREVWPGGRTNHYWFDLNRDWLPVQLPESNARINIFHQWLPNISTDHHEMGSNSTYFFQPGIQSRVHPLTPLENQKLTKEIGNFYAKSLDKIGSLYFTEEQFDDFYFGKGSTYPDINGGIGILFEQASSRGHTRETSNGLLTFSFTIKNQLTTAISTIDAANVLRPELLNYQKDFYINSKKVASKDDVKSFVFSEEKDKSRLFEFANILKKHKIAVYHLKSDINEFQKEHSLIVPTNQKNYKTIKAIFEKRTSFTDSLFYDISGWTFPLSFNLKYKELKTSQNIGQKLEETQVFNGKVTAKSNYAYLMEWHDYYSPKVLFKLLKSGLRVKFSMKQFSLEGNNYDYGTLLIPVQNQTLSSNKLYDFLTTVVKESNVIINGVETGLTEGIDLGSNQFRVINTPKVAVIVGSGISSYDAGEVWHLFDQKYEMPLTKIDTDYLRNVDLSKYSTIILPNARRLELRENTIKKLKDWVNNGGVLIGYKNAVKWLSNQKFIGLEYKQVKVKATSVTFEQRRDFSGAQVIGGAIFNTKIDRSHPINFGISSATLPMFRRTKLFIKPDESSYNNPIQYTENPLLSGYISKPNLEALKGTVPFQVKRLGKGKVIVFTDNTNFRAFWYGTNKLLMNAVFFNSAM
jgi:hypothetical protein